MPSIKFNLWREKLREQREKELFKKRKIFKKMFKKQQKRTKM